MRRRVGHYGTERNLSLYPEKRGNCCAQRAFDIARKRNFISYGIWGPLPITTLQIWKYIRRKFPRKKTTVAFVLYCMCSQKCNLYFSGEKTWEVTFGVKRRSFSHRCSKNPKRWTLFRFSRLCFSLSHFRVRQLTLPNTSGKREGKKKRLDLTHQDFVKKQFPEIPW